MTAPDILYTTAQDILASVVAGYGTAGITLPDRQYVADGGEVALDCELVAVALARVFRPVDLDVPQRCVGVRTAEYHVWIVRCASVPDDDGNAPSTTLIESFAAPMMTDAWLLPNVLGAAIGDTLPLCDRVIVGDLVVHGPEGGFVGVDLTFYYQP